MKNLITLSKNAISICFLLFLSIVSYGQDLYNFTQVKQNDGLIMRRVQDSNDADPGIGLIDFYSDTIHGTNQELDYIYMRATPDDKTNNLVITNDGTLMVSGDAECRPLRDMKAAIDSLGNSDSTNIKLMVNGDIAATSGNGTITILSDKRFKKNIVPLKNSLEVIRESNFVEFQYNDLSGVVSKKKYYGVLAQEMQKVLPSTVTKGGRRVNLIDKKSTTDFLMFNPNDLIYSGLNAIKELDKENQDLKDRVAELEAEVEKNKTLEERVNELEKILARLTGQENINEQATSNQTIRTNSAYLYQNRPNPARGATDIAYRLPDKSSRAKIIVQDLNGHKITEFDLQGTQNGTITFNPRQFGIISGTYIYSLLINGVITESQKMIFIE